MYSTTLRIDESLGHFLQEAARRSALSVNAFLAELIRREQEAAARKRLAQDWRAYAQEEGAQDVNYALAAQAQVGAMPKRKAYQDEPMRSAKPKSKAQLKPKAKAGATR